MIRSRCGNCLELTAVGAPRRPVGIVDVYPAEPPVPPTSYLVRPCAGPARVAPLSGRCAQRGSRGLSVLASMRRTGFPHAHAPPYRKRPVARRVRGLGSAVHVALQFAARCRVLIARMVDRRPLPGVRSVLVSYAVRGSFTCGSECLAAARRGRFAPAASPSVRCASRRIGHA